MQSKWTLRLITALLWALAAGSAVYWALRVSAPRPGLVLAEAAPAQVVGDSPARQMSIARLLGAPDAAAPTAAAPRPGRFSLAGIAVQGNGGAALLVVDGKAARPYRVGSYIDDNTILQSVGPRHANLAATLEGPVVERLELAGAISVPSQAAPLPRATPPPATPDSGLPGGRAGQRPPLVPTPSR